MIKKTQVELVSGTKEELLEYFQGFIFSSDDPRTQEAKRLGKECYSEFELNGVTKQIEDACDKGSVPFFYLCSRGYKEADDKMIEITISLERIFIHVVSPTNKP